MSGFGPHPNGKLEILYQLYDNSPSYYEAKAKETESLIANPNSQSFKSAFDTVMNPKENNIFRCISMYIINQILQTKKLDDFLLKTRNDYLPIYLLENLNFQSNIETKSRFSLGFPDMVNLGYPSVSKLFVHLYNLNPNWPELTQVITQNPPFPHHITIYLLLNFPLTITIPAFEGILQNLRQAPLDFVTSIVNYKDEIPIELIARFLCDSQPFFFFNTTELFVRYHNSILANKHLFTNASSVSVLVKLLKYDIYTPFEANFEESAEQLAAHFCVIDGEQRGYSNPPLYKEFRVYMKKAAEMFPDKYATFLSHATEDVLSAFSFEYDEKIAKRVFEDSYCPWVYVVLFHDKLPKELVPWEKLNEFEPAPDLVNSIKLYSGIDDKLMNKFLNEMSVAKFVYLFHDYYDCKSIPHLKERLLNDRQDYDTITIFYEAIKILGDAVDISHDLSKYFRFSSVSSFLKVVGENFWITKEDAKSRLNSSYFLNYPSTNPNIYVLLIRRILTLYPDLVEELKEKLQKSYFAPLFLKEFIANYEYDHSDPKIIVALANFKGVKELTPEQVEILISTPITQDSYGDCTFKAIKNAFFTLKLNQNDDRICQVISNLIQYFIHTDDHFCREDLQERKQFLQQIQSYFVDHYNNIREKILNFLPISLQSVFDYIEMMYKLKL